MSINTQTGRVAVLRKGAAQPFLAAAENDVFCCKRVWGEHLEHGLFAKVERSFQVEVDSVLLSQTVKDHLAVSGYVSVWQIRDRLAEQPPDDAVLQGLSDSGAPLTKDQEEILEKKGAAFARRNKVLGRFGVSITATRDHDINMQRLGGIRWGVLIARNSRLICPDRPDGELCIPITPTIALVAGYADQEIKPATVDDLNRSLLAHARCLAFAAPTDQSVLLASADRA